MRRRIFIATAFAFGVLVLCGVVAWVGGYNFDHRSEDVAVGLAFSLVLSLGGFCAGMMLDYEDE